MLRGAGGTVGGDDAYFKGDAEGAQPVETGLHGGQIGVGAHDDSNFFLHDGNLLSKIKTD